jgi:RNA polymerase sigma factor (sigma-70 family)
VSSSMAWEAQAEVLGGFADEAGLVAALRAGKGEAFEALHASYATRIYNLALRIVDDQEEAQDVAQEVLLKVFRGLPGNETDLNLPAWLYRVTVNAAFDHVRARKRRPVTVVDEAVPEAPSAVDEFERAELARRVESTLRELPKRQQIALVLRDVHGLSVGETASVLGLTKGSADVLLSRARTGFRRVFLTGAGALTGRCDRADKALATGVGRGEPVPAALLEHSQTCPDCRRAVKLWGAAPVGLALLLPQVALPAKLSLGATLAAAQAAGIAVPAGLGAAAATGASASAAGASAAAGVSAAGTAATATAGGAGFIAALGSATGVKIATLAAVATAAVGMTGVVTQRADTPAGAPGPAATAQVRAGDPLDRGLQAGAHGSGRSPHERARLLAHTHRSEGPGPGQPDDGRHEGRSSASGKSGAGSATAGSGAGSSNGAGAVRSGGAEGGGASSPANQGSEGSGSGTGPGVDAGSDGGASGGGSGQGGDTGGSGGESQSGGSGASGGLLSPE